MLISNSLRISSANLATRGLDEPPKTISSTYTCTIRISLLPEKKQGLIDLPHLEPSLK
jgi:hypothetical protein